METVTNDYRFPIPIRGTANQATTNDLDPDGKCANKEAGDVIGYTSTGSCGVVPSEICRENPIRYLNPDTGQYEVTLFPQTIKNPTCTSAVSYIMPGGNCIPDEEINSCISGSCVTETKTLANGISYPVSTCKAREGIYCPNSAACGSGLVCLNNTCQTAGTEEPQTGNFTLGCTLRGQIVAIQTIGAENDWVNRIGKCVVAQNGLIAVPITDDASEADYLPFIPIKTGGKCSGSDRYCEEPDNKCVGDICVKFLPYGSVCDQNNNQCDWGLECRKATDVESNCVEEGVCSSEQSLCLPKDATVIPRG
ncbi:MAG: hypothetical protein JNK26_03275 [Candidatus Doudnabacteria bacterium]|nr:hypothetical protein [Candidatus Doudnabacteria bacterium]